MDAHDLREVLQRGGPLEVGRALWIAEQVAQALDAAHQRGLVHRDVKPANILLTAPTADGREHAYLVDFGVARPSTGAASITSGGMILGTPSYAAPEQLTGGPVDARTDVRAGVRAVRMPERPAAVHGRQRPGADPRAPARRAAAGALHTA